MNLRKDHYRLAIFSAVPCEPLSGLLRRQAEPGQGVDQAVVDVKVGVNPVPPRPCTLIFFKKTFQSVRFVELNENNF